MARNVRWFIPFKSQNGTSCRVDIYDNDWPSGVSMGLRGAADPFYYEEDNSDDLLNNVLRYRTGYIRVVENYYGELADIYPSSTFDRYVEFYYGSHLEFNGYIQMQDFSNTLEFSTSQDQCPRVIELPVISPLGLWDRRKFSTIMPPTTKTLGQLLDIVLNGTTYQKVTLPNITGIGLHQSVFSLVVSPWNENYHHSMNIGSMDKVMEPETYSFLIEGICKAFGWICHDTPQALVFTSFDYMQQYVYYPVKHIGESGYKTNESVTQGPVALTDAYTLADNDARVDTLLPESGIEVSYDGHLGHVNFSFDRTYFVDIVTMPGSTVEDGERWSLCNLSPVGVLNEITGVSNATFENDGKVTMGNFVVAWNGHIGVLCSLSGAYPSGQELFRIRLYTRQRTNESWTYTYEGMSSQYSIAALQNDDLIVNGYIKTEMTVYADYVEVIFKYEYGGTVYPQLAANYLIFIHNIRFEVLEDNEPYAEYRYAPAEESDALPSNNYHPAISSSVTMPISLYRLNDRMIGDTLRTTKITEYPYLFQKRLELEGKFRAAVSHSPDIFHTRMWTYLSKKWRLIAQSFHPWDDEYTLTLQHSSILDATTYSITTSATNTSLEGYSDNVYSGTSFNHLLYAVTGYSITSVVITMGGVDVTSTVYDSSTGQISIASVTGNVVITVVATELPYDAEVEYLQSDGTAYIDTGIKAANTVTFDISMYVDPNSDDPQLFGGRNSLNNKQMNVYFDAPNKRISWGFGNNVPKLSKTITAGEYSLKNTTTPNILEITDSSTYSITATANIFTSDYNIFLFALNNGGNMAQPGSTAILKTIAAKFYSSGTLVRDYIPVRKNGVGYLYDKVNGTLFGNANSSGAFTYGNDKTT